MRVSVLKPEITGKHSEKRKKTTYWKPKECQIPKYKLIGGRFLHLACQGVRFEPLPPSQLRHWQSLTNHVVLARKTMGANEKQRHRWNRSNGFEHSTATSAQKRRMTHRSRSSNHLLGDATTLLRNLRFGARTKNAARQRTWPSFAAERANADRSPLPSGAACSSAVHRSNRPMQPDEPTMTCLSSTLITDVCFRKQTKQIKSRKNVSRSSWPCARSRVSTGSRTPLVPRVPLRWTRFPNAMTQSSWRSPCARRGSCCWGGVWVLSHDAWLEHWTCGKKGWKH